MRKILLIIILTSLTLSAQQIPSLPYRIGAGSAETYNNHIYYFGGSIDWSGHTLLYDSVFVYNGSSWSVADTIPDKNLWDVETVRVGNEVYLISGWPSGPHSLRKFNLDTYKWTYLANSPNATTWGVAAEYVNGHIYLFNPGGNAFDYNIATDQWSTKANAGISGTLNLSSIEYQNEIYIIGFSDSTFIKYNPASDQWIPLAKTPYKVGASAMGIINDKIYNVGGNIATSNKAGADYKSVIVYDITQNKWDLDSLQISAKRHWMATAEYLGGLYVLGGIDSLGQSVDTVQEIVPQGTAVAIGETKSVLPKQFVLYQNYPNPFNPSTVIRYQLPANSTVTLKVYDITGREIKMLINGQQSAGEHTVTFHGDDLPSGVYFYKLITSSGFSRTRKMILVK